mgnify:CR=1 FL=1
MAGAPDRHPQAPEPLIVTCSACARRFKAKGFDPNRPVPCPDCGGGLIPATIALPPAPGADIAAPPVEIPSVFPAPFGKYTLLRELGRGGMGVVFEALDTELQRVVALKTMRARVYDNPKDAADDEGRFQREARLCAALPKHPHIVTVFDMGVVEKRRYLAMEFIAGRSMHDWTRQEGMTLHRQIRLLRDIALAVHHAHEHNVIHRDLKPANVIVDRFDQPHVTDFGLSKATSGFHSSSLTASGLLVGTPSYMSPEQAKGERGIDRRSDVYALGVMLYEIVAGRLPFAAPTPIELLMKIVNDPVVPPSRLDPSSVHPDLDKRLEAVCLKAMRKDPAERHPTAQAFAEDLTRWLEGADRSPAPAAIPRRRALIAAVSAVAAAGLAVALWGPGNAVNAPPPAAPAPAAAPAPPALAAEETAARLAAADRERLDARPAQTLRGEELSEDRAISAAPRPWRLDGFMTMPEGEGTPIALRLEAGAEVIGGRIDLRRRGRLVIDGAPDRPVVLRGVEIIQDHGAALVARHAVFDRCTLRKGGGWFSRFSSRWTIETSLLFETIFERLDVVDYGIQLRRCALIGMTFPGITMSKGDESVPYPILRTEWTTVEACAFAGCTVPPSLFWCTARCDFDRCRFPAWPPYAGEAPITVEASLRHTDGPGPVERLAAAPAARGAVTLVIADAPCETVRFPEQARSPIPELRHDPRYKILFAR